MSKVLSLKHGTFLTNIIAPCKTCQIDANTERQTKLLWKTS